MYCTTMSQAFHVLFKTGSLVALVCTGIGCMSFGTCMVAEQRVVVHTQLHIATADHVVSRSSTRECLQHLQVPVV